MLEMEELKERLRLWEKLSFEEIENLLRDFYDEVNSENEDLKAQKTAITKMIVSTREKEEREELNKKRNLLEAQIDDNVSRLFEVKEIASEIVNEARNRARLSNASYQALKSAYEKVYSVVIQSERAQAEDVKRLQDEKRDSERYLKIAKAVEEFLSLTETPATEKGEN